MGTKAIRSKSNEIEDDLRRKIAGGMWKAGEKIPDYRTLSRQYAVTTTTIAKVMNSLNRQGIIQGAPGRGTFLSNVTNRTGTWGFLFNNRHVDPRQYPILADFLVGLEEEASLNDEHIIYSSCDENKLEYGELPNLVSKKRLDGVVAAGLGPKAVKTLVGQNIPVVIVADEYPNVASMVVPDDFAAGSILTEYLVKLGHRRILFFCRSDSYSWSCLRVAGYRKSLEQAGVEVCEELIVKINTSEEIGRYLEGSKADYSAIIVVGDNSVLYVVDILRKLGKKIPDDVSVATFNDQLAKHGLYTPIGVTSINIDFVRIGREAIKLLQKRLLQPEAEIEKIVIPVSLSIRESTAPVRIKENQ